MGKKLKAGKKGEVAQYITRTKAIRKLQLTLKDFRRLCILKGIYPRDPRRKLEGNTKTYYHVKDIAFLTHDPLINRFREMKSHIKKYKRALVRGNKEKAERMLENSPRYTLDHLIKERYPTFQDALRDLDDPLCLINLFASFPSDKDFNIPRDRIQNCQKLSREFNLFLIRSRALRKAFLSIKGVYLQAEVLGTRVTWIVPYPLAHDLPHDVDYRVMLTFLEFYETLLKFINFRLYKDIGLEYPPAIDTSVENANYFTYAALLVRGQTLGPEESHTKEKYENNDFAKFREETAAASGTNTKLFEGLTFYLSRETFKGILELLILSFGGQVLADTEENFVDPRDKRITHIVTDREPEHLKQVKGKEYLQPQWLVDSVNNGILLPLDEYRPGKTLPPHLSPFIEREGEAYVPQRQKEIDTLKGEAIGIEEEEEEKEAPEAQDDEDEEHEGYDFEREQALKVKSKKDSVLENKALSSTVLTKKNRRILERIRYGKERKLEEAARLKQKAKKLKSK